MLVYAGVLARYLSSEALGFSAFRLGLALATLLAVALLWRGDQANALSRLHRWNEAKETYRDMLASLRRLAEHDPDAHLPTVATTAGGPPEIGGDAALYFDPPDDSALAELLEALIDDEDLRRRRGHAAREQACKNTWEHAYEKLLTELEV